MTNDAILRMISFEDIRADFENKTALRDECLADARQCIKHASLSGSGQFNRGEEDEARQELSKGRELANCLRESLRVIIPNSIMPVYTQDALKELRAELTVAMVW